MWCGPRKSCLFHQMASVLIEFDSPGVKYSEKEVKTNVPDREKTLFILKGMITGMDLV